MKAAAWRSLILGAWLLALPDPAIGGWHLHVVEGESIIADAVRRIRRAGAKYHLQPHVVNNIAVRFREAATAPLDPRF